MRDWARGERGWRGERETVAETEYEGEKYGRW